MYVKCLRRFKVRGSLRRIYVENVMSHDPVQFVAVLRHFGSERTWMQRNDMWSEKSCLICMVWEAHTVIYLYIYFIMFIMFYIILHAWCDVFFMMLIGFVIFLLWFTFISWDIGTRNLQRTEKCIFWIYVFIFCSFHGVYGVNWRERGRERERYVRNKRQRHLYEAWPLFRQTSAAIPWGKLKHIKN